ncbi:uncharacterized protein LOC143450079 [Clavelina lepadiformis]|uniref:uncharacterized protein LOC143450079 n=1 Tax=Clavelina lepadiformis TaxID=159417 RepID=UPI0040429F61
MNDPCEGDVNCRQFRNVFGDLILFPTTTLRTTTTDFMEDEILSSDSAMNIVLPILIVLGVLIIIAMGFLFHRIIVRVVRKREDPEMDITPGRNVTGAEGHSAVNTVSGRYSRSPPSYGQVMAAIERQEMPPSYYQVVDGVVNLSFITDLETHSTRLPANATEADSSQSTTDANHTPDVPEQVASDIPPLELPQTPSGDFVAPQGTSTQRAPSVPAPPYRRSPMPPVEEPLPIVIQDIDELVDSISVPSILSTSPAVHASTSSAQKKGLRRETFMFRTPL